MKMAGIFCIAVVCFLLTAGPSVAQETTGVIDNITATIEATTTPPLSVDISSFLYVKYYVREDNINEVAAQLISNATAYNITVDDLLQLTQIESFNFTEVIRLLDQFDLTSGDLFNFQTIEATFKELNISILTIYRSMAADFIPEPRNNIPVLLSIFGINRTIFDDIILYGTDSDLFELLNAANFTAENVQTALQSIQKTTSDLYAFVKPTLFLSLKNYPISKLLNITTLHEITVKHFQDLLGAFNLRPENYFAILSFRNGISSYVDDINSVTLLALVTNATDVVSINLASTKYNSLKNTLDLYVEDPANATLRYKSDYIDSYNDGCLYGPVVLRPVGITARENLVIAEDYSQQTLENCQYVTVVGNVLVVYTIPTAHNSKNTIIAEATNETVFIRGSPIFCGGKLHGLAEEQSGTQIGFRTFYCDEEVPDTTTIFSPPSAASHCHLFELSSVIGLGFLYLVFITVIQ